MISIKTELFTNAPRDCRITCDDKYLLLCLHEIAKTLEVENVTDIKQTAFSFTVKNQDEILSVIGKMETKALPYCAEAHRRRFWRGKQKFWLAWAVLWGTLDFTLEIIDFLRGRWQNALVIGLCGLWIVLWSLRNYWQARNFENGGT